MCQNYSYEYPQRMFSRRIKQNENIYRNIYLFGTSIIWSQGICFIYENIPYLL